MKSDLKVLGIIGIRSGSKGIKDKNIKFLIDKPLVGWIIETANKSSLINRLIVSTDSVEYAEIAKSLGAEIPYIRPKEFAQDYSSDFDFVNDLLEFLALHENYKPDYIVRLMATSPLQSIEEIDEALRMIIENDNYESITVVAETRQHPLKAMKIVNENKLKILKPYFGHGSIEPKSRQSFEPSFHRANVIVTKISTMNRYQRLTGEVNGAVIIDKDRAVDIDSEIDFKIVEKLLGEE